MKIEDGNSVAGGINRRWKLHEKGNIREKGKMLKTQVENYVCPNLGTKTLVFI